MTIRAWMQGFTNMLVCGSLLLLAWLAARWLISLATGLADSKCTVWAYAVVMGACFLGFGISWTRGFARRGALLLDCGRHPTRGLFVACGSIFFVQGVAGLVSLQEGSNWRGIFFIVFSAYWLFVATGRLTLHENGIWTYWALTPWNRIQSYAWSGDGTLIIKANNFLPFVRSAIPISEESRQAVEDLLRQHVDRLKASGQPVVTPTI